MKVLILGIDGYIGWPLALHLKKLGHEVSGVDSMLRRHRVEKLGAAGCLFTVAQRFNTAYREMRSLDARTAGEQST